MTGKVAIGLQDFETVRTRNIFYVDKTDFIRQWWDNEDSVTLITHHHDGYSPPPFWQDIESEHDRMLLLEPVCPQGGSL